MVPLVPLQRRLYAKSCDRCILLQALRTAVEAMTINPESLPDELVEKALDIFYSIPNQDDAIRAAIAAFLNGAAEVGLARKAKASKSYSSTKRECWIASDAWEDDWPVLILRLPEGEK
jgi:hypothetical protein